MLPGPAIEKVVQQIRDVSLDLALREDCGNAFRESIEVDRQRHEHALNAAVFSSVMTLSQNVTQLTRIFGSLLSFA